MEHTNRKINKIQSSVPNRFIPKRDKGSDAHSHQRFSSYTLELSESSENSIQIENHKSQKEENTQQNLRDQLQYKNDNRCIESCNNDDYNSDSQINEYETSSLESLDRFFNSRQNTTNDIGVQTFPQNIIYPEPILKEEEFKITFKKSNPLWKTKIQIYQNDNLFFQTSSKKDKLMGKIHIVTFKNQLCFNSVDSSIIIVRRSKGTMFTLYENNNKIISINRQIAGFSFYTELKDKKYRMINLAIPNSDCNIISDEKELSQIALEGESCQHVSVFSSSTKNESYAIKSNKNFTIYNHYGVPIFRFYKISNKVYKVKFRPPLTHTISYSISLGIITSHSK